MMGKKLPAVPNKCGGSLDTYTDGYRHVHIVLQHGC